MSKQLSILIPTFNDDCTQLVTDLRRQAEACEDLEYEIIVADDGSTNQEVVRAHEQLNTWDHCRFVRKERNTGRAAIRNYLSSLAQYPWLLFIDSDMSVVRDDFIQNYISSPLNGIRYGGYEVIGNDRTNLRNTYECAFAAKHTIEKRRKEPYQHFHTSNFMTSKQLMEQFPFDERFRFYGYEDDIYGKCMKENHIEIEHIDNPIGFSKYESNEEFLRKTEEGLRTLLTFSDELTDYSTIITVSNQLKRWKLSPVMRVFHQMFHRLEYRNLCGKYPSLFLFKLYKLSYYMMLQH